MSRRIRSGVLHRINERELLGELEVILLERVPWLPALLLVLRLGRGASYRLVCERGASWNVWPGEGN